MPPADTTTRAPDTLVPAEHDDVPASTLVSLLARSLENQTNALVREIRSLRNWMLAVIAVLGLALAGIAGANVHLSVPGVGSFSTSASAAEPPAGGP